MEEKRNEKEKKKEKERRGKIERDKLKKQEA